MAKITPAFAETIIIGGGVIGCSVAYHLAKQGIKPLILEREIIAAGSSGACDGLIFFQSKKPGFHLDLAIQSIKALKDLTSELEYDFEFRQKGGLIMAETPAEVEVLEDLAAKQKSHGVEISLLDGGQAREIEPKLSQAVCGASYCPHEGHINPMRLTRAYAQGAQGLGVKIIEGVNVDKIIISHSGVEGVQTSQGRFAADLVINAAGSWAGLLGPVAGVEIPITPRRGQLLVTEPMPPFVNSVMLSAKYIAAKFNPELADSAGQGVALEQTEAGSMLVGSTREFAGFDRSVTRAGLLQIAANAARLIPALKKLHIIRSFAGLRPYTPDGLPILGQVPGVEGLVMAAGHEGDGITLSAVTGRLVADYVAGNIAAESLHDFRLERFKGQSENP
ncbi:MAG: FAD-dependent oxidoreductase [Desulfarculaceae bacterium]|jgi:sarcosine oxidase subunit beta